jgi:3-deoxy-D-manno-octulosonate 8-phosphate phosphatase (KDO 8-P phosphatase)
VRNPVSDEINYNIRQDSGRTLNLSSKIKLIVSDFDGIFTDNSVYIFEDGNIAKKLSYKDIMGVSVAVKNGIGVAIISGSQSKAINYLDEKFELAGAFQNVRDKLKVLKELLKKNNLSRDEILYIGDDINDIECLREAGCSVTVRGANRKVLELPDIQITRAAPGDGAFREVVDSLVREPGEFMRERRIVDDFRLAKAGGDMESG